MKNSLKGKVKDLDYFRGYSAYEIAVINGFVGTEEEWLASLKGADGDRGDPVNIQDVVAMVLAQIGGNVQSARITDIEILADGWIGEASPYSQVVAIDGVTENSQVDLTPSVQQLAIFYEKDLTFVTENDGGVVTVYAIGQKPANDYTIQATITEVLA